MDLKEAHHLSSDEARALAAEPVILQLFREAVAAGASANATAKMVCNDVLGEARARKLSAVPFNGQDVAELVKLVVDGTISSKQAKGVLGQMFDRAGSPKAIVDALGLRQVVDAASIEVIVDRVLLANADAAARFKAGNINVLGALVGLAMKESKGTANPKVVSELLRKKLA
jgi:Asp-tRNA(Asn)/Glu-tRNA(Gln) amidotransferase B subunit